jgi:hypothetical protein
MRPLHDLYAKEGNFHKYGSSEYEYLLGKRSAKKLSSDLMIFREVRRPGRLNNTTRNKHGLRSAGPQQLVAFVALPCEAARDFVCYKPKQLAA